MELKANKTMADFVLSSLLISLLLKFYVWFAFAKRPLILSLPSARTLRDSYRTCLSNLQEFRCNTVMYIRRHTTTKWSLPRKRQEKQSSCHDISISPSCLPLLLIARDDRAPIRAGHNIKAGSFGESLRRCAKARISLVVLLHTTKIAHVGADFRHRNK